MSDVVTREQLLASRDQLARREVDVEGLGRVVMRELLAGESERWFLALAKRQENGAAPRSFRCELVQKSLINPDGSLMFKTDDIELMESLSNRIINQLSDVAWELSGMSDQRLEETKKNLESDPADGSP